MEQLFFFKLGLKGHAPIYVLCCIMTDAEKSKSCFVANSQEQIEVISFMCQKKLFEFPVECLLLYLRYYEVAFGPKVADSYNVETAEKLRTNETKLTLMNLTGYMPYLIQVRAMTTEPGPWSKPLKLLTAMEGLFTNILFAFLSFSYYNVMWVIVFDLATNIKMIIIQVNYSAL